MDNVSPSWPFQQLTCFVNCEEDQKNIGENLAKLKTEEKEFEIEK